MRKTEGRETMLWRLRTNGWLAEGHPALQRLHEAPRLLKMRVSK